MHAAAAQGRSPWIDLISGFEKDLGGHSDRFRRGELMQLSSIAAQIYEYVARPKCKFPWPKSQGRHASLVRSLSLILPADEVSPAFPYSEDNREQANRSIRSLISPLLKGADRQLAANLAVWIVKDWGGIRAGPEAVRNWSDQLGDFSACSIESFVREKGRTRISSWSKVLAFASPDSEAIYDSRTAVALNCALAKLGHTSGFYMPLGRNAAIVPVYRTFRNLGFRQVYGYLEYVELLKEMAKHHPDGDVLGVEMSLFAKAPTLALNFRSEIDRK